MVAVLAFRVLFFSSLLIATLSCTRLHENPSSVAVLTVNGDKFTAAEFSQQLAKKLKHFDALAAKDPTNIKRSKEMLLNDFVVSSLLRQFAQTKGQQLTNEELSQDFEKIRKSYPDDLTFKASLAESGTSVEAFEERLRKTALEKKAFALIGPAMTGAAIAKASREYYDTHKPEFQRPAQVHIKQIVVAKRDDAERILQALKGGTPFETLAKKYSISPDSLQGGDIDYIAKGVVPAFDSAFNLKPGQISGVIVSSYGFHILKLVDKRSATLLNFEQAESKIALRLQSQMQQEAFQNWLANAVRGAKIERNDAFLNKLVVRTEGSQE